MNKLALGTIGLTFSLVASTAQAQNCPPGSWLCAGVNIQGGAQLGPPGPVYVQQQQGAVYVQPPVYGPGPRVYVVPPRPRVYVTQQPVYVQPPPVVVYQPPPRPVYYQQPVYVPQPVYVQQPVYIQQQGYRGGYMPPTTTPGRGYMGLQLAVASGFMGVRPGLTAAAGMLGIQGGLRFHGARRLGAEITIGGFGGTDWNGDARTEFPLMATGMLVFNPDSRFQVYGLAGLGLSWSRVNYAPANRAARGISEAAYTHGGGALGLGAELQLSRSFALFADVRGFLRTRLDSSAASNPEFARTAANGSTETTNTSGGVAAQAGLAVYF